MNTKKILQKIREMIKGRQHARDMSILINDITLANYFFVSIGALQKLEEWIINEERKEHKKHDKS